MTITNTNPSIYVACLASYNNGKLHGSWIDCTIGSDYVKEAIRDMLADSPEPNPEEWAIHDSNNFGAYDIKEWHDIENICEVAEVLKEENGELIIEVMNHLGSKATVEEAKQYYEDNYQGSYSSLKEYGERWLEDTGSLENVPDHLRHFIDFEAWAKDCEYCGDIFTIELHREIHVFYNN